VAYTALGIEVGILYRLTGPDGMAVSFNDPTQPDFIGYIEEITGLDGPDTREASELLVEGDGGVHDEFWHGRRPVTISGLLDPNAFGAERNLEVTRLLQATNAMRGDAVLTWTPTGGVPVRLPLRRQQPPRITGARVKAFQLSMIAADARILAATAGAWSALPTTAPTGFLPQSELATYRAALLATVPGLALPLGASAGLTDISGNALNGTAVGGPTVGGATGPGFLRESDTATDFDGGDDAVTTTYATRRNIVPNPSFEVNSTGWTFSAPSWTSVFQTRATNSAPYAGSDGGFDLLMAGTKDATATERYLDALTGILPGVAVGEVWTGSVRANITDAPLSGGGVYVYLVWYTAADAFISFSFGAGAPAAGAQTLTVTGTAPATAAKVQLVIRIASATASDTVSARFDAALLERAASAGSYFPTVAQLAAGDAGWTGTAHQSASDLGCFANGTTRTFMGWARRDATATQDALMGGGGSTAAPALLLQSGSNDVIFAPAVGSTTQTWTAAWPGTGQWVHWALVFNEVADTASLYINGALASTKTGVTVQYSATAGAFEVGRATAVSVFDGKQAWPSIHKTALTAGQIRQLYEVGRAALLEQNGNAGALPVMTITGPITNPVIYNLNTGQQMAFTYALAAGDRLVIDAARGTVVDAAGVSRYGAVNFALSSWWELEPGFNDLRLSGTGTDARTGLSIAWNDSWI
jgi:hypothetical protein